MADTFPYEPEFGNPYYKEKIAGWWVMCMGRVGDDVLSISFGIFNGKLHHPQEFT